MEIARREKCVSTLGPFPPFLNLNSADVEFSCHPFRTDKAKYQLCNVIIRIDFVPYIKLPFRFEYLLLSQLLLYLLLLLMYAVRKRRVCLQLSFEFVDLFYKYCKLNSMPCFVDLIHTEVRNFFLLHFKGYNDTFEHCCIHLIRFAKCERHTWHQQNLNGKITDTQVKELWINL